MATARDWILVLFGRFVRERGGWVPVRQLTDLLEPLGVDAASVRTAISRMKRSGVLEPVEHLGLAGYRLTDDGEAFFADGDRRVLEGHDDDDRWVLASFSVPEAERGVRYKIRTRLLDIGFGQESSGLMIAPARVAAEAERTLRRDGLDSWVSLWVAEFGALGSIADVVARAWDTEELRAHYDRYVEHATTALGLVDSGDSDVFVRYMQLVNEWRELRYRDAGLPLRALPDDWPRPRAAALFAEVEASLYPRAAVRFDAAFGELTGTTVAEFAGVAGR